MSQFLKKILLSFALVGLSNLTFAGGNCGGNQCYNNQSPPPPAPLTGNMTFEIGGGANFSGFAGAVFEGSEGFAKVEKTGYGFTETTLNAAGNLCGINCQDGSFTFSGAAGESVKAMGGAFTSQSGLSTTTLNEGQALSTVKFNFSKTAE